MKKNVKDSVIKKDGRQSVESMLLGLPGGTAWSIGRKIDLIVASAAFLGCVVSAATDLIVASATDLVVTASAHGFGCASWLGWV